MGIAKKKLVESIRKRAWDNNNGVFVPRNEGDQKTAQWPTCQTCRRAVDSVNVEDVQSHAVTIRARCHGEECTIRLDFPFRIMARDDKETWEHIHTSIRNSVFFEPSITL